MATEYYYLAAGLPEIELGKLRDKVDFAGLAGDCADLVSDADRPLFQFIRYPYDHANLLALLKGSSDHQWDNRGYFSRDQIEKQLKGIGELPDYMVRFIRAYQEKRPINSDLSWEDQLFELFFEEVLALDNHFIYDYYLFELDLRNVLAAINYREMLKKGPAKKPLSAYLLGGDSQKERIVRSNAPDFGLSGVLPWVEKVAALSQSDLTAYEKSLDELRLAVLDDLSSGSVFGVEVILATCLRAAIAQRWQELDKTRGKAMLDNLLANAKKQYSIDTPQPGTR